MVSEAKQNTQAVVPVTELQNRARQVKSAIKRLADERLIIRNPGDPKAPYSLMLLHESGGSRGEYYDYVIPEWHENPRSIISIPIEFFTHGWVYLLSDTEIRMYFILRHLAIRFPRAHEGDGVYLIERDREWHYGITRDIYEAHLTLSRFGLIRLVDNPLRHRDGKVADFKGFVSRGGVVPLHRFKVEPVESLRVSAARRIRRALLNYPPSYSDMSE